MSRKTAIRWAAGVMFLGVAMGAFGAHGLEEVLRKNGRLETWGTGVDYHLVHGLALLALAFSGRRCPVAWWGWLAGIAAFSGGLYLYSVMNIKAFGMIAAPIGGVLFLVGWLGLLIAPGSREG